MTRSVIRNGVQPCAMAKLGTIGLVIGGECVGDERPGVHASP